MPSHLKHHGWLCALVLAAPFASAQTAPDASIPAALRSLSDRAGMVFAGEVIAIRPLGGVVEIDFRIDRTLKGQASATATLREWAGLWATGERRYWLGERAVVFLHPPGKSGLSSSVDGMEGILPLIPDSSSESTLTADIERLRTRVVRAVGEPLVASTGHMSLDELASTVRGNSPAPPVEPPPVAAPQPTGPPPPVHGAPVIPVTLAPPGPAPISDPPPTRLLPFRKSLRKPIVLLRPGNATL